MKSSDICNFLTASDSELQFSLQNFLTWILWNVELVEAEQLKICSYHVCDKGRWFLLAW